MIKVKIDEHGYLFLLRGKQYRTQYCPYAGSITFKCGDWCPLFQLNIDSDTALLTLCRRQTAFRKDEVQDDRLL
jgi:hypothetical protein